MRKLMWFSIGFGIAMAICACLWIDGELLGICGGFAFAFLLTVLLGRRHDWVLRLGILCLGLSLGFGWYQIIAARYISPGLELDGKIRSIVAQCTDYSYETEYGTAVDVVLPYADHDYRARLYLEGTVEANPGDLIYGDFKFSVTAPGSEDPNTYHQGNGRFLLGYQTSDAKRGICAETPWWGYPAVWRQAILNRIDACFPEDAAPFAKALLLGERMDLDYETETAFKVSGISHIVAVSGLHVSILFALVYLLCLHQRWLTAIFGIPALIVFAAVAGFSPSITRACIMQILMIMALCLGREYDPPTALAFSALVMLVPNPFIILSISFQLTVGCMAGIFLFREPLAAWLRKHMKRWLAESIAVTVSAMSLTTPLLAWHFGTVSLLGVVTNLLVLWVVSFIFYGVMLVCILSAPWLGWLVAWPIRYVLGLSALVAKCPLAAVYTASVYIVIWLVFCYVLLTVFLFVKKDPEIFLTCGVLGLVVAVALSWGEQLLDDCRVTVLDVGQGQSILLQSSGKTWMVDCGGSWDEEAADTAAERLMSQGVFRLDGIIVTHYDVDHAGGVPYLLTRIPTDAVFLPGVEDPSGIRDAIESLADQAMEITETTVLSYAETNLTIFRPMLTDSDNESSLCVLFQAANCDILITSDRSDFGEKLLMREYDLPPLEILIAGHHGAKTSTSVALLEATRPVIVAISAGENPYGHPAEELLARLAEYGCAVYRTDLDGTLIFRR